MKISLKFKILGSFALIVFLALGAAVGSGNKLTRSRYDDFAYRRDFQRAESLSASLGDWTAEALEAEFPPPFPPEGSLFLFPPPVRIPENRRPEGMMDRMMDNMMDSEHMGFDRMVITDLSGNVLLDAANYNRHELKPENGEGVLILKEDEPVGYLYLGNMIPDLRRPDEVSVLQGAGIATWFITGFIFIVAMILGLILTRHIIGPIKVLNQAANDVEGGNLSIRVPEERRDELGELSRGFNSMTTSLESADRQRRRLVADSAHELRTPISLIRTRIEMMEEGIYPMDAESLSALSAESERLTRLADELKTLANLEAPDFSLQMENLDPGALIDELVAAAAPALHRRDLAVDSDIDIEKSGTSAYGDRDKLQRLLSNLLSNAIRHAESRISISVHADQEHQGWTVISVEDDGPGIPVDERDKVFQRYYRTDSARNRSSGGSGLGLAICAEIVKAHGGDIEAGKSEGHGGLGGARIELRLPPAV